MKTLLRALSLSFSVGALILLTGHAASDGAGCSSSPASKETTAVSPPSASPSPTPTQAAPASPPTQVAPAAPAATPQNPPASAPPASAPSGDAPAPGQLDLDKLRVPDRFMGASKSAAVFFPKLKADAGPVDVGSSPKAH
ncbi:MAG: hypothetical protein JNM40_05320 [Myxococcales bacterium]|nr:hypothetical protein [Myxococcales bacterium]